jgi:uncharacterized protein (TIGR02284 family)
METKDVISTLNDLIETSKDGENGFRACADAVKSQNLKQFFETAANRCAQGSLELQAKVQSLGGHPETSGSTSASLHRGWVNLKSMIMGKDEAAVLEECERGEDVAKRAYEKALDKDLPADVRSLVQQQYEGVRENHDRVRDMRNAVAR